MSKGVWQQLSKREVRQQVELFQETGTNDNNEKQQRGRIRDKTEGIGASESAAGLVRHVLLISCLTATFHLNLPIKIQFRPFLRRL